MRALFLLFLASFALAQAPKPLKVGELTGEALYPGNRGVSYGEVGLVARGLGLALWQGESQVALGLGARYRAFPVEADEAKAASSLAAWRKDGRVYVPLRPLADALGLSYEAQVGIQLDLPWARLLQVEARPEGYLLRFSREVNAVVRPGGVLFLMAQGSHPTLVQEALGLFLPLSRPPERVYYPGGGQVAVGLTPLPLPSPTVLLDPGHGGEDPGLEVQGLVEKEVALDLARRVAALLPGARLTRQGDETLPPKVRLALARTASVVVSLHMARGREVRLYLPKDRTSPLAQSLSRLGDLPEERARLLRAYAGDPARLAEALERALTAQGFAVVKAEGPYVLTRVDGAAVLLEVGAEKLGTEEARALVAQAIAQGIRAYLEGGAP
ncbi:N-acetylmuramoyl-L-alanine amidase family protein [Thermus thermophilus]|uniref:N-acetylmuramoyl-L-alanine amidase n=1 Tax=Thermus thermophilus JL-18 TaxID=798128 RepID=H9ZRS9_THETH|nr:N-acetylmuramoyl-L-alanine amidase [Thermus thermophilus]AFH39039.1 N-acetylmuramoyl-L-alanine amidase [Thermus thermophilus JL-18]